VKDHWSHKIFKTNEKSFMPLALEVFRFQYAENPVYRAYADALGIDMYSVSALTQIPFLPISFFKNRKVVTTRFEPEAVFRSSGTTGMITSHHHVKNLGLYRESFTAAFASFYGSPKDHCIIGLLPSYLERMDSSLVYMVKCLIEESGDPKSGFYLDEYERLQQVLKEREQAGQKTLLIGVTFALLDFAERFPLKMEHTIVMETGGMKGRREELVRHEVHEILKKQFQLETIHSEYGMTELLSQAYSKNEGIFNSPPWMKVLVRDDEDPLSVRAEGNGVLNIIDLANIYSCSFIATDDAGKLYADGSFEVLGRVDGSDLRGCSLLTV